jgi:CheY-like chemotaxis protein
MSPTDASQNAVTLAPRSRDAGDLSILVIGNLSHPEMANVLPCLRGCCQSLCLPDIPAAIEKLAAGDLPPELIVLALTRPGVFGLQPLRQLRSLAPLAGYCVVLGSQCEGEMRTGKPLLGMPRVFWHAWPTFWAQQIARRNDGLLPAWTLPATVSEEDRLLSHADSPSSQVHPVQVAILAETPASARALANAVAVDGHIATVWKANDRDSTEAVEMVVWDAPPAALADRRQVEAVKRRSSGAALLGVATFPRYQERAKAVSAGVDAILAKPFLLDHLLAEIARLATPRTRDTQYE